MTAPNLHRHEQRILVALLSELNAAGFKPAAVYTGDCYVMAGSADPVREYVGDEPNEIVRPMTYAEVLQVFEDYIMGSPTVHFTHKDKTSWGNRGVQVVPGSGQDFISDWHCGDEAFNAVIEQVCDKAGNRTYE